MQVRAVIQLMHTDLLDDWPVRVQPTLSNAPVGKILSPDHVGLVVGLRRSHQL